MPSSTVYRLALLYETGEFVFPNAVSLSGPHKLCKHSATTVYQGDESFTTQSCFSTSRGRVCGLALHLLKSSGTQLVFCYQTRIHIHILLSVGLC